MNKAELVEALAKKIDSTKSDTAGIVDAFIETIQENLHEGIKISGLGTFSAAKRKARIARNPQTGEEIKVPAKWAPVFKASSGLKEAAIKRKGR